VKSRASAFQMPTQQAGDVPGLFSCKEEKSVTQVENSKEDEGLAEGRDDTLDALISAALGGEEISGEGDGIHPEPVARPEAMQEISASSEAPEDWPEAEKAVFAALPPEAREMVLNQYKNFQAGFTRKSQELSDHARFAEAVRRELEPFRDELAASGVDEAGAVRELVRLYGMYRKNPKGYARMVAGRMGASASAAPGNPAAFLMAALEKRLAPLERQFRTQQVEGQRMAREAFAGAKDTEGAPRHPHFEKVQGRMAALIQGRVAKDMEDAYAQAVWSDPELREQLVAKEKEKQERAAEDRRIEALEKAKKAGARPASRSGASPRAAASRADLDSLLDEALTRAGF